MTQIVYDGRKAVDLDLLAGDAGWNLLGNDAPLDEDVRRYYEYVGLVYRCTHIRGDSLSKVPWVIANARDETVWQKDEAPPPQLDWLKALPRLLHKSEKALTLGSTAYWHKERNRVRITGLRWFAPLATAPWWDAERGLTHFVRNIGTRIEHFPVEDIVYLRYEYPLHETLRDRSPAEAALRAAGVLYNVDNFVANFFERGAIKATLLTVKGNPPKTEMERIKAWWKRFFMGIQNAFGAEVLNAEALTPLVVGEGIGELSNSELTGEKRNDIVITMGVPLSMVFSDAANYATAEQDEKNFYNSTIVPDCELIAEQVNEQLLEPLGLHLVFKPEAMDIFQTDENEKAQSFATYVSAGMKQSIAAQMLGLELPDGVEYKDLDEAREEARAMQPAAANGAPGTSSPDEEGDPAREAETQRVKATFRAWAKRRLEQGIAFDPADFRTRHLTAADKQTILAELKGGGADQDFFPPARVALPDGAITPSALKALRLQLDPSDDEAEQQIRMALERQFGRALSGALAEQLATLLPDGADDATVRAAVSQVTATSAPVREVLRQHLERASSLGVSVALDTLQGIGAGFDWTLAHAEAADWASRYSYELIHEIDALTQRRVQRAVETWFTERTTLPDLVRELQPTFGKRRAQLIAQTETTRAAAEGSITGYEQSGVVQEVEWYAVRDERVCPTCGGLHGQRAPLRGTFAGGYRTPAHPGCRCFVRPVIAEASAATPAPAPARRPGPTPQGPPVSGALKLPSGGKYKPLYEEAMSAIDAVHGDGALGELPVVTKSNMDAFGHYRFYQSGKPLEIAINGQGDHHQLTLAHEVGHWLDHQAIGTKGQMASERDAALEAWRQAVDNSAAVERLRDKRRNPFKYEAEVEVSGRKFVTKPDPHFTSYLLDRRELWARSYAQYIAQRSGNATMLAQLVKETGDPIYGDRQWSDEDFAPIAAAIEAVFRGLGWLQ